MKTKQTVLLYNYLYCLIEVIILLCFCICINLMILIAFLQAYHITNDEPIEFWTFMTRMIVGLGYPAPKYHIPFWLVYMIALILQVFVVLLRPIKTIRPTFTPMTVALAGTNHYYSCDRAKKDFAYKPLVPLDEAIRITINSFSELKKKVN